ncbi:MAG: hypothetical protein J1F42_05980 [Lachnospiraceae bacterium]|nr:hypothetical protein [Lachnospiraceae bacterium]
MSINEILNGCMAGYETERVQNTIIEKLLRTYRADLLAAGKIIDARAINRNSAIEAYREQSAQSAPAYEIKVMHNMEDKHEYQ